MSGRNIRQNYPRPGRAPAGQPRQPQSPCHQFARRGSCNYGDSCRFSHEAGLINSFRNGTRGVADANGEPRHAGSTGPVDVMQLLRSRRPLRPFQFRQVFQEAITTLDSRNPAKVQQLIEALAKESGLQHIRLFLESHIAYDISENVRSRISTTEGPGLSFLRHGIAFLQVLSHGELRHSMVMEKDVGTIFNVVYGPGGDRGINFLHRIMGNLETMAQDAGQSPEDFARVYSAVVGVILFVVKLNAGTLVQREFKGFAERLVALARLNGILESNHHFEVRRDLLSLGKRLDIGETLATTGLESSGDRGAKDVSADLNSLYLGHQSQHNVDFPGVLSTTGPRHNNDDVLFQDIQILPTADEISRSDRPEFLPVADPSAPHFLEDVPRLLDSQFRLLREDNIGPIRDALRNLIQLDKEHRNAGKRLGEKVNLGGTKVFVHQGARIEGLTFHAFRGLQICVGFEQPKCLKDKKKTEREAWWETAFSLDRGALVCYVDGVAERCTLLVVSERIVKARPKRNAQIDEDDDVASAKAVDPLAELDLAGGSETAVIRLSFPEPPSADDISWLREELGMSRGMGGIENNTAYLIEFPKVLLASFKPVLACLQKHMTLGDPMPFDQWLVPGGRDVVPYASPDGVNVDVPPAAYARTTNFSFNLGSILQDGAHNAPLVLDPSNANRFDLAALQRRTTLDYGQCAALVAGLTKELALIQGPPGTGKSYVGVQIVKVLVDNKRRNRLLNFGPIVCVCFTNHALDQLLEDLIDNGITNIIRLGTRSKSTKIKLLSMDDGQPTPHEMFETRKTKAQMFEKRDEASSTCMDISKTGGGRQESWKSLMDYLDTAYPHIHDQLEELEADEDGFVPVKNNKRSPIEAWVYQGHASRHVGGNFFDFERLTAENVNVWNMSREQRQFLVTSWMGELAEKAEDDLRRIVTEHSEKLAHLDRVQQEVNKRQLEACDVVGVTTSGFAKNIDLLRSINAKVLLSEEAGEILEAHTLTNLLPNLEHIVLIGDHLQLRPKTNNYELSVESRQGRRYCLDVSLFERLTRATFGPYDLAFPTTALDVQRRMHPSIAQLVRSTLYPKLKDHPDVLDRASVAGMRRRLFWLDHHQPDSQGDDSAQLIQTSYTNKFEQKMVLALTRHLLRQGHIGSKGIAIITPYVGQLLSLRRLMSSSYDIVIGDRDQELIEEEEEIVEPDDNEGGQNKEQTDKGTKETAPVSPTNVRNQKLLNAVRLTTVDNFQGEEADVVIVSLVRSNRQNNCGFLKTKNRINVLLSRARHGMYILGNANTARSSEMWEHVAELLEQDGNIGPKLELECPRHKEKEIFVKNAEEFSVFSPEGGCDERCTLRLECGHSCRSKCHSAPLHRLVPCDEPCNKRLKGCDHPCQSACSAPCGKCKVFIQNVVLPCQHVVKKMPCHQAQDIAHYQCTVKVNKTVPGCGHPVKTACSSDVASAAYVCTKPCGLMVSPCGHTCTKPCNKCRTNDRDARTTIDHGSCKKVCDRPFNNCAHSCQKDCHAADESSDCGFCIQPCGVQCGHSRCPKKCSEPCAPCAEMCRFGCEHEGSCRLPCAVPCEIMPCSERCSQTLSCGHQCPSLCGEKCPNSTHCPLCASKDILDVQVDFLMMETFGDIDPDESPLIFLPCSHFFTVETMDGIMELGDVYQLDNDGRKITGLKAEAWEKIIDKLAGCPSCRAPISNVRRYSYIQKRAQMQIATRKFISQAHKTLLQLESELTAVEKMLEESRNTVITNGRHNDLNLLSNRIEKYTKSVAEMEQPFNKVYDLAFAAQLRGQVEDAEIPSARAASSAVQFRFRLEGMCLLLRAKTAFNCDRDMVIDLEKRLFTRNQVNTDADKQNKQHQIMARRICTTAVLTLKICEEVITESLQRSQPAQEVEARIYFARQGILRLKHDPAFAEQRKKDAFRKVIVECLDACDSTIGGRPSTAYLKKDVDDARKSLNRMGFFSTVTDEERRAVYHAMAREFQGTGHWYYCPQGHPFTIGECGMAMETARCPQCDSVIGGANHTLAAGLTRANEFEAFAHR